MTICCMVDNFMHGVVNLLTPVNIAITDVVTIVTIRDIIVKILQRHTEQIRT